MMDRHVKEKRKRSTEMGNGTVIVPATSIATRTTDTLLFASLGFYYKY